MEKLMDMTGADKTQLIQGYPFIQVLKLKQSDKSHYEIHDFEK